MVVRDLSIGVKHIFLIWWEKKIGNCTNEKNGNLKLQLKRLEKVDDDEKFGSKFFIKTLLAHNFWMNFFQIERFSK